MQDILKESGVSYNTFINDITEIVRGKMGPEYSIRIYKVTKNNSLELDSLVVMKEGKNFAPNIYLMPYYEAYLQGAGLEELADQLCVIYRNYNQPIEDGSLNYTFEEMKPNIIYRLVSYEKNHKLLKSIPHIKYLDLAITFHCLVHNDPEGIGTIRITNEHINMWKISVQELKLQAAKNTKKHFPPAIRSMDEIIRSMLEAEAGNDGELTEDLMQNLLPDREASNGHKMYVLTNRQGINGATCLLYKKILRTFSGQIQKDLYILPSSIHEVILVPYDPAISKETLAQMVKEVNGTQVAREEVLSDKVYFYSWKENAIIM